MLLKHAHSTIAGCIGTIPTSVWAQISTHWLLHGTQRSRNRARRFATVWFAARVVTFGNVGTCEDCRSPFRAVSNATSTVVQIDLAVSWHSSVRVCIKPENISTVPLVVFVGDDTKTLAVAVAAHVRSFLTIHVAVASGASQDTDPVITTYSADARIVVRI